MSWLKLADRCAIVTGASSGIGRAVALELQRAGCGVVLADRHVGDGELLHRDRCVSFPCDVTDRAQVDSLMRHARHASVLVNCAGVTRDGFVGDLTEADWDTVVDVNLKGTFNTCQSFLRHSDAATASDADVAKDCSIVNVGSVVSEQGNIGQANYAASKGGVLGLTRALAREAACRGVRVNAVVPGFIETPMSAAVPEKILESVRQRIALRRFGKPEEVAALIAFLASERSGYITGETIECSGMISL